MEKNKSFIGGVFSLLVSQVFVKILGMIYSIYLINKEGFGDAGNAIYLGSYQIFAIFLTISSIGVPSVISKLISEKIALNDEFGAKKILKVSLVLFILIGFIEAVVLFGCARYISNNILQIPETEFSLIFLSPAIFFVSITSVLEGYFNGRKELSKTAKAQIIEQFLKMLLIILIVHVIGKVSGNNTEYMAAGANFATTLATVFSAVYLIKLVKRGKRVKHFKLHKQDSTTKVLRNIFKLWIPISLGALLGILNKNIDAITVVRMLKPIVGDEMAKIKYGILTSKVDVLLSVPLSFNMAFTTALIPEISGAKAQNDSKTISEKIFFSIFVSMIISVPAMIGLNAFSNDILNLLFPNASKGAEILRVSAFLIPLQMLVQTISGILHGLGKTKVTTISFLIGTTVKFICNIVFLQNIRLLEKGAVLSSIICYSIILFIMVINLLKICKIKINVSKVFIKPLIAGILMAIISRYMNTIFSSLFTYKLNTVFTIFIAVIIYIVNLFILKAIKRREPSANALGARFIEYLL